MHKSDKIHAHTIMMHSVQALYCNWDCHWDCLRILGYIDNFLDRAYNATQLADGLNKALYGDSEYSWFIQ